MGIGFKIRALLLLLGICCIVTAISVNSSITESNTLRNEAEILQKNLKLKQQEAWRFLNDKKLFESARTFHKNADQALRFIDTYRDKGINILTYEGKKLKFWSSIKAFPENIDLIGEGSSPLFLSNGLYECLKKTEGNFTIILLITIKNQFNIENQYLVNKILPSLSPSGALDIVSFTDKAKHVMNINKLDGKFLFSVKLIPNIANNLYSNAEIWLWISGVLIICIFVNSVCVWVVKKGHLRSGTFLLILFVVALRLSDLQYGWLNHQFNLEIFNPRIYAESFFLPSLGDLLLNIIALTWVAIFVYSYGDKYDWPPFIKENKPVGILIHLILCIIFGGISYMMDDTFYGLIYNSRIAFDISLVSIDWVSWVCVLLLCLAWFVTFLIAMVFFKVTTKLNVTNRERLILFLAGFIAFMIFRIMIGFTAVYIAYSLLPAALAYNVYVQNRRFSLTVLSVCFFSMALVTSVKYTRYIDIRERDLRANIATKLETADDPKVVNALDVFEKGVKNEQFVIDYFEKPGRKSLAVLQNQIEKKYLGGYLAGFEISMFTYDNAEKPINNTDTTKLEYFKQLVKLGAIKTLDSNHFYRINDTFGYQNYFGIFPFGDAFQLGTLVVELKSQPYNYNLKFPDLLIDGKIKSESEYNNYSFGFYNKNVLVNQSGKITYNAFNASFSVPKGKIVFVNDYKAGINHLVYAPTASKLIIISKDRVSYVTRLATLSFFFLVFIFFAIIMYIIIWLISNLRKTPVGWFRLNRYLMINANQILYKTRIQFSIVLAVVVTLLAVGWTTFSYISKEYTKQQTEQIQDKIRKVQIAFEKQIQKTGIGVGDEAVVSFNQFADINGAYLNLFSLSGDLLLTSIPKLYDNGIIGKRMGAKAFVSLSKLKKSEYINKNEKIGDFKYAAAYVPVKNAKNQTVAYLGSPFYNNEEDYNNKIGLFINTLINIYALVFVAIGILAVFLANQITSPLTFIQESISKTNLGSLNKPIHWSRNDEIGALIREYNKMIAALETSASKLARSERENAWREMAKQVAHEIKNPLTPLKLGVQLLERSWKENDPNFEKKFENFNRSFIEQIDSLATIASEFSNFAKMPDTKLENIELMPIIEQAKDVYKHTENAEISIIDKSDNPLIVLGDKDQLLRTFNNLLKNAIEAVKDGSNSVIKIVLYNNHGRVVVSVEDNGKGISKDQQDRIFAPNFTTKTSGTGLGLAFVKQAVENAGGEITFSSESGVGTTFFLSFPEVTLF